MRRITHTILLLLTMMSLSSFADNRTTDVKVRFDGKSVNIDAPQSTDGWMKVTTDGAKIKVTVDSLLPEGTSNLRFILSGKSTEGAFQLFSCHPTDITLEGLDLRSRDSIPLRIKNKNLTTLTVKADTENILTVEASEDTAKTQKEVLYSLGDLNIKGKGRLSVLAKADGCKGINVKSNLQIDDLDLIIKTTGDNLGIDTTRVMFPGFPGGPDGFPGGPDGPGFPGGPDKEGMHPGGPGHFPGGQGFPGGPEGSGFQGRPDFPDMPQHPEMPEGMNMPEFPGGPEGFEGFPGGPDFPGGPEGPGGPGGKQNYMGTCKGIKAVGTITINSGNVSITTESRGAEGIEGKQGVTVNGGTVFVKAVDDAINSGGAICFNGGETTAWSTGNDAIDSNSWGEGAITIAGGRVFGYCQRGAPEEGFDCDFSPIVVKGGTAFGIGAGMGEMPSTPTEKTATQPAVLFLGLDITEGDKVELFSAKDKKHALATICKTPFNFRHSSSLFTCPELKVGEKYILKVGKTTREFTLNKTFQIEQNQNK